MGALRTKSGWAWIYGAALVALAAAALRGIETDAAAGTQQCNTECQSKMTDCILACDGMRSCEEACKKKGQSCVEICSSDAGPPAPLLDDDAGDAALVRDAADARASVARDAQPRPPRRDR